MIQDTADWTLHLAVEMPPVCFTKYR